MSERYTFFKAQPRPVAKNATPRPPPAGMGVGLEIQGRGFEPYFTIGPGWVLKCISF